jgi:hypothetical protein
MQLPYPQPYSSIFQAFYLGRRVTENKLREHFHLPLTEVAKKFGMCNTAFKKLCRKQGIMQWPYRTLRSLEKKMASLRAEQKFSNDNNQIEEQISKLQAKREQILSGSGGNISHDDDPVIQPSPSDDSSTRQVFGISTISALLATLDVWPLLSGLQKRTSAV